MPLLSKPNYTAGNGKSTEAQRDFSRLYRKLGVVFTGGHNGSAENLQAEECPFCEKESRFYVDMRTGQYHCFKCQEKGNVTTFLTRFHRRWLERTTSDHRLDLKAKRGIASQTLATHELAWCEDLGCWLIPFKNPKGNISNLQLYYPDRGKPNKFFLPGLPTSLYCFDRLMTGDMSRDVLLCEGPFDAIAVDYNIGSGNRKKYVVMASPGTSFKPEWAVHFRGRNVRILFDNDESGRTGAEKLGKLLIGDGAGEVKILRWPESSPHKDLNDLLRRGDEVEPSTIKIVGWVDEHSYKVMPEPKLIVHHGRRSQREEKSKDWLWPNRLHCGTYASFSGQRGSFKTTIACEIAARYTTGCQMPTMRNRKLDWEEVGMPPGHVLYIDAENGRDDVENKFEFASGDFDMWHFMAAETRDDDSLNILDHLPEIREMIREFCIRLVIIDGQNSVVGAPNISTDMLARNHVTNPLHHFAQRENICLLGMRNEDREGRALGPQSMGDIGRCIMRSIVVQPDPPFGELEFSRVSGTARSNYPTIPYAVRDRGDHAEIVWGESLGTDLDKVAKDVAAKKGQS
jgi:hypothetical protein